MRATVRPCVTAGVALVGATAVAVAPVLAPPSPPDIQVVTTPFSSTEVHLTALANPFEVYGALIEETLANLSVIGERIAANPAPILQQLIANQLASAEILGNALQLAGTQLGEALSPDNPRGVPANLRVALDHLMAGNIEGAIIGLWQATITPLVGPATLLIPAVHQVIRQPVQNLLNVVDAVQAPIMLLAVGALNPVYTGLVKGGGAFAQDVFDAVTSGDLEGLANAFITGPAGMIGGLLNGDGIDSGLLTPNVLGTINQLLGLRDAIAGALGATLTVSTAADEISSAAIDTGDTVTLDVTVPTAGVSKVGAVAGQSEDSVTEEGVAGSELTAADDADGTVTTKGALSTVVEDDGTRTRSSLKAVPGEAATGVSKTGERPAPARGVRGQHRDAATSVHNGVRGVVGAKRATTTGSDASASSTGSSRSGTDSGSDDK